MRSGTSYFDWTVFKKTVFRFWPLWGVYFVGWLITLPLSGLTMWRLDRTRFGYVNDFAFNYVAQTVRGSTALIFAIFGVLAAMAVFSHLYNARSANLFGSLPIRREGLFLTHYLAGLAFLIVPNIVIFLLTMLVEVGGDAVCWTGLLFWLAVSCGESFFFYSLAVFCAMFTGHILALPAFYAIVNGFVAGMTVLVNVVLEAFYYGFAGIPRGVYTVVQWFTPASKLSDAVGCSTLYVQEEVTSSVLSKGKLVLEVRGLGTVGIYAIVAVALAVCAFFLYRARRLESAGDVVAVNVMKPVFRYGVALCAGLALGLGTSVIIGGEEIALMIAIAVWGIIGYFAAEMLLQKSFRVFKKWKGAVAVTAVFAALFCVVGFDLTGFETRIPDPASVESAEVSGLEVLYLRDDGDWLNLDITDPEIIRLITLVHRAAVDQKDADWETEARRGGTNTSLTVTYHLKNGGALTRRYYNVWVRPAETEQEGTASWAVQRIYNSRELCWQMYGFDRLENYLAGGGRLTQVEYSLYDDYSGSKTYAMLYGTDAETLFAAMKEDFFAGRIGARRVSEDRWGDGYLSYGYLNFISDNRDNYGHYSITIAMSDTASGVRAALEEMADRAVVQNGTEYDPGYAGEIIMEPVTEFLG